MLLLILLAGLSGAGYAYWLLSRSDEILRTKILEKLAEIAPEWEIGIERARFDLRRRIHVYNLTLKTSDQSSPFLTLPQTIFTVDRDKLINQQEVEILKIRFMNPVVDLVRDGSGRWNWQDLPPLPEPDKDLSLPECELQDGTVRMTLEAGNDRPAARISLTNADVKAIPSAKRHFVVRAITQVQEAGKLSVEGTWNFDEKSWNVDGEIHEVVSSGQLLSLAVGFSPELRTRIVKLEEALEKITTGSVSPRKPFVSAGVDPVPDLGISGTLDVDFRISRPGPETEPEFELQLNVQNGQIVNAALPFPLHDVAGKIFWDNDTVVVHNVTAKNGVTHLRVNGKLNRAENVTPGRFHLDVRNLALDNRLRNRLPAHVKKHYVRLRPSGYVDLRGLLDFDGREEWTPRDFVLTSRGCSMQHEAFPYSIRDILGKVTQRGNKYVFNMLGQAGRRPVRIEGSIINPGPEARVEFLFHVERFPIDDALLAACDERTRTMLDDLNLRGSADVWYRFHRHPGLNQKPRLELVADLKNCTMEADWFPYELTSLEGTVTHASVDGSWAFQDLKAKHGTASIAGRGAFLPFAGLKQLDLELFARNVQCEEDLHLALPAGLQKVWKDFSPAGRINVDSRIRWIPGRRVEISLPVIEVSDASFVMRSFPLPIEKVKASLSYEQLRQTGLDKLTIKSFSGVHDEAKVNAKGWATFTPNGDWRTHLTEISVDDLLPDRLFRNALPEELRSVFDEMDPRGAISFSGSMDFKGTQNPAYPVTAAWNLDTILTDNKLTAGVDLEHVNGVVSTWGTWDGREANLSGKINLNSVHVWDHQFTQVRGPFQLQDTRLIVGAAETFIPRRSSFAPVSIPSENRITASAIGGTVILDADVRLEEEPSYRLKLALQQGRLEEYAHRYIPGANSLRGVMTGELALMGKGKSTDRITGNGWLQISPAALYELPVVLQIFNALPFAPPDKTAFMYAQINFNIGNKRFHFNRIELIGNTISLYGQGVAGFNGNLNLEFYSKLPPSGRMSIPIVEPVFRQVTKDWVGINVTGKVKSPKAVYRPLPQVDDAVKRFLSAFESRPSRPAQGRMFPPVPGSPSPFYRPGRQPQPR